MALLFGSRLYHSRRSRKPKRTKESDKKETRALSYRGVSLSRTYANITLRKFVQTKIYADARGRGLVPSERLPILAFRFGIFTAYISFFCQMAPSGLMHNEHCAKITHLSRIKLCFIAMNMWIKNRIAMKFKFQSCPENWDKYFGRFREGIRTW